MRVCRTVSIITSILKYHKLFVNWEIGLKIDHEHILVQLLLRIKFKKVQVFNCASFLLKENHEAAHSM